MGLRMATTKTHAELRGELLVYLRNARWLFWDYDDTLAPTEGHALRSAGELMNLVLQERNIPPYDLEAFVERFPGTTFRKIVSTLATELGFSVSAEHMEELVMEEQQRAIAVLDKVIQPSEGANDVLHALSLLRFSMAVVTGSSHERIKVCLERTGQNRFFTDERVFSVASSLKVPISKPEPVIYLHTMDKLGVRPEECVAIEDSKSGVRSAVAAGIPTLGYVGALVNEARQKRTQELFGLGAFCVIENFSELQDVLCVLQA